MHLAHHTVGHVPLSTQTEQTLALIVGITRLVAVVATVTAVCLAFAWAFPRQAQTVVDWADRLLDPTPRGDR